jgi:hypothetical protein
MKIVFEVGDERIGQLAGVEVQDDDRHFGRRGSLSLFVFTHVEPSSTAISV